MKGVVHPSEISSVIPVSFPCLSHDTENSKHAFGLISENSFWMCLVRDTSINIFSTETGRWRGSYCFGDSLNNPSAKVTNVVELISSHISYQCLLVSINQDHESLLCMYNVDSGRVMQSILIPDRISSLSVVSGDGGVCMNTHHLNRRLRYMFGVVVIGTINGYIYFLDLCLDENFSCDETCPNITLVLRQHECSAPKREAAIAKKQHIFLRLNDETDRTGKFELHRNTFSRYALGNTVTAVKYFKSIASIAVGFSSGGIQVWELQHLTQQFTISPEHNSQPIVNFAFQEPENDPRNFCYLWVFRGHNASEEKRPDNLSNARMYSMTFHKRDYIKSFGHLYSELQTCIKRFEFPFLNDIYHCSLINPAVSSRLLSCQVIHQKELPHTAETSSGNETCEVSEHISLCLMTWEVWAPTGNVPSSYHFAVFDLNQWYQAQMPCTFKCDPSSLSPYFGVFSLDEMKRAFHKQQLFGIYTIPESLKQFKSLLVAEEFFYPSSLGFQTIGFSQGGVCKMTYFGFQKHLLFEMAALGPKALINPKELFSSFIKCGLITDSHGGADRTPLVSQREALMQLALEYHLPFFFIKCMKEWRYSDSAYEYCTSRSILNWAWKKVLFIKSSIDRMCVTLFNCSGYDVDKTSIKSLYAFRKQLHLIDSIVACFQKYVTPRSEQGIQDLECRREALSCINMYLQVLLWLRSVHVLPEVCEDEATTENVIFKVDNIVKCYNQRRSALQALNSSIGATDVLLIDGLVKEVGIKNVWQEKSGSGNYPPPSIYAALGVYLLKGMSIEWKHALTYYLLLDLIKYSGNENFKNEIKKFPVMFDVPKCISKLVEAFWYLDRKDCSNAIKQLFDPAIKQSDILLWQNSRIMKSFLYYSSPENALKYMEHMTPPQNTFEDIRLYLSVLLSCGAVSQAFEYQRKRQTDEYAKDLLRHLFLGCLETGKMQELMYLPLNNYETSALIEFLSENENPKAQEGLVMYHLLHCNFFEAQKINEKLSISLMKNKSSDLSVRERTTDRVTLVESLLSGISNTEISLIREINRLPPKTTVIIEENLKPLSVSVKANSFKKVTYASFLNSLIDKASLVDTNAQTPKRFGSQPDIKELPFVRHINTPETIRTLSATESEKNIMNKRSMLSTSPNDYTTPAKRSRLLDNATFMDTPLSKKKPPKHLAGDIASLLHTPPIHRRVSLLKSGNCQGTPEKPASILKKLSMYEVEQHDRLAETPPLEEIPASEGVNSEDENMQVDDKESDAADLDGDNLSKQLRFDVPISEQSISESVAAVSETSFVDDDSNSALTGHPDEVGNSWRKSMPTLTREPLEEYRKHSPELVSKTQHVAEESENVKAHLESSFQSTTSELGISKQTPAVVDILDTSSEVEIIEDITPDADSDSEVEVIPMETDINKNNFGLLSSSIRKPAVPDYFSPASQRKTPSPRPPLRSESSAMDIQEVPLQKIGSDASSDVSGNNDSKISPPEILLDDNTIIDDSDMEIFYSPCSSGIESFSDKLAEKKRHSVSSDEMQNDTLQISLEEGDQNEKTVAHTRKPFVFSRQLPITSVIQDSDKKESQYVTMKPSDQTDSEIKLSSGYLSQSKSILNPKKTQFSRKTFVFSKPSTVSKTHEEEVKAGDSELETNIIHKTYLEKDSKEGHKTFTVPKAEESFSDTLVQKVSNINRDGELQNDGVQISEKDKILAEKTVAPSRNKFTFSKQLPSISDKKQLQSVSGKPPDKTFVCGFKINAEIKISTDNSSQCDVQKSTSVESSSDKSITASQTTKASRKKFVFSKPHIVSETYRVDDLGLEKNTVEKKSDNEGKNERETKTKLSRKTFTFSKPIPVAEVVQDVPPSHSKEPEIIEIVGNREEYNSKLSDNIPVVSSLSTDTVMHDIAETETDASSLLETKILTESKDQSAKRKPKFHFSRDISSSTSISNATDKSDKITESSSKDSKKTNSKNEQKKSEDKNKNERETKTKLSHKIFTFSKPIPVAEVVQDVPPSHLNEPEIIEIVGNRKEYSSKISDNIPVVSSVTTDSVMHDIAETETNASSLLETRTLPVSKDQSVKRKPKFHFSKDKNSSTSISNVTDKSDKITESPSKDSRKVNSKNETGKPSAKFVFTRELRSTTVTAKTTDNINTAQSKEIPAITEQIDASNQQSKTSKIAKDTRISNNIAEESSARHTDLKSQTGQNDNSEVTNTAVIAEEDIQNEEKGNQPPSLKMVVTRSESKSGDMSSLAPNVQASLVNEIDMDVEMTEAASNTKFLRATKPESYAQFSSTLLKATPRKGKGGSPKKLLSSPRKDEDVASIKESSADKKIPSKASGSAIKKKKAKGKTVKKMEFSFAEPTSPATPDILEVLEKTPAQDKLTSFMFSPPLTRGRLRQKKIDETFGSSFSSMVSDTSYSTAFRQPPVDPILESIIQENSIVTSGTPKKAVKKRNTKKSRLQDSVWDQSQISLNETTSSNLSLLSSPQRHSMRLRQAKAKQKSDN